MRPHDLRADSGGRERAEATLRTFFGLLVRGDWERAAEYVLDPFDIMGQLVPRRRFRFLKEPAFPGPVMDIRGLPPETLQAVDQHGASTLYGGQLEPAQTIFFVTVPLAESGELPAPATYGVVVDLSSPTKPRICRLFDPGPFKRLTEMLKDTD